jgi:hypothetical protein
MNKHLKIFFAGILTVFTCFTSIGYAQTSGRNSEADTAKIRSRAREFADNNNKVKVTTSFSEKAQGRIVKYGDTDFTLKDSKSGVEKVFKYENIWRIDRARALSPASIITIAAAGAAGAIVAGFLITRCRNEGGC